MATKCPKCGADAWSIIQDITLTNGPHNIITNYCNRCGYEWQKNSYASMVTIEPTDAKITTKYKELKDWLVENYSTRNDVDRVYRALCKVLDLLDENAMRGIR